MRKFLVSLTLAALIAGCGVEERVPRTTVLLSAGRVGPALTALVQMLPEGFEVEPPAGWDTLDVQTALAAVLVDAQPDSSSVVQVGDYTLPYDSTTGLYVPVDSEGVPVLLELSDGDPIVVYSPQDTVRGSLPQCPRVVGVVLPETVKVGSDFTVSWSYDGGEPDSALVAFKVPGRATYTVFLDGSQTSVTIPGSEVQADSATLATVTVSALMLDALEGGTPGSYVLYSKSEVAPVVVSP